MSVREVTLRYCTASGEVVTTPLHAARAETIVSGLPIRIPPTYRGQHNYPGLFWAATNRRTLVYESLLELDRLWLADFDSTAVGIATQPFQIAWREGSATRFHVPDVLLTHADRRVNVIDVKPESLVNKPEVKRQFESTREMCRDRGWDYEVFTGDNGVVLRNIRALAVGRRPERLPEALISQTRESLSPRAVTVGEALAKRPSGFDESLWRAALFAHVWSGEAKIDLRSPLSNGTLLHLDERVAA